MAIQHWGMRYRYPITRRSGFHTTLMEVREPHGVWRPPRRGATLASAVKKLQGMGLVMVQRSSYNGRGFKITTEFWGEKGVEPELHTTFSSEMELDAFVKEHEEAHEEREYPIWHYG